MKIRLFVAAAMVAAVTACSSSPTAVDLRSPREGVVRSDETPPPPPPPDSSHHVAGGGGLGSGN
jgi:hypothetical protein